MIRDLIAKEKQRLHELEQQVIELDKGSARIQPDALTSSLKEVSSKFDEIEELIKRESKQNREDYRRLLERVRSNHRNVNDLLQNYYQRHPYLYSKSQLFNGKVGNLHQRVNLEDDMALELAENGSLTRSSRMVNDYINVGRETLDELVNQRERLKGIQRRAFDILNYLGLSNTIMKNVELRDWVDKWIVYIGMAFIVALMFVVWWFVRK
eukprot:gene11209-12213_t